MNKIQLDISLIFASAPSTCGFIRWPRAASHPNRRTNRHDMWKKMCISVFFPEIKFARKKNVCLIFFWLGWWVCPNLSDLPKWARAQNPTDVAFSSPFSWNKVTKQTIRKKMCKRKYHYVRLCEFNFMRWQLSLQKIIWHHNWHHWYPSYCLKALGIRCFPIPKKPIDSHSSLHQHSYFSITSASSLAYPWQQSRLDGYLPADLGGVQRSTIFQNAPLFPTVPSYPARGTRPRGRIGKTATDQCHHDEKTPFLETPQLDPTKIGFDKSNMEGTFHTKATLCYPSAEMMSLQDTFSSFSFLNCLWISFLNKELPKADIFATPFSARQICICTHMYIYVCIYIYTACV